MKKVHRDDDKTVQCPCCKDWFPDYLMEYCDSQMEEVCFDCLDSIEDMDFPVDNGHLVDSATLRNKK